jgi:hypothetical protein
MPQSQTNSYSSVAKRIFGWTNNGIATAAILLVALVGGRQLISLWRTSDADLPRSATTSIVWPTFESCAIEFSNQPYQLKRLRVRMSLEAVPAELIRQCEIVLADSPLPVNSPTASELSMLDGLRKVSPQKVHSGYWRIFCGQEKDDESSTANATSLAANPSDSTPLNPARVGLPLAVGIRDNCPGEHASRMVVWAIATEDAEPDSVGDQERKSANDRQSSWTIFVCRSTIEAGQSSESANSVPIPPASRRTLAVTDWKGGQLIGFSGGDLQAAMNFFSEWGENHGWRADPDWQNVGSSWQVCFHASESADSRNSSDLPNLPNLKNSRTTKHSQPSPAKRVRVQISSGPENRLRGLIIIEPISAQP